MPLKKMQIRRSRFNCPMPRLWKSVKSGNYSGLNFNNIFQEVIKEEVGFDE